MPQLNGQHKKTKSQLPQGSTQRRRRKRTRRNPTNNPNQQNTSGQKRQLWYQIENKQEISKLYHRYRIPVTIVPNNSKLFNPKDIHPLNERYQDVNKNEIKILGNVWAYIENNGETTKLPILITQRDDITPLLGVNRLKQLPNTINKISLDEHTNQSNNIP